MALTEIIGQLRELREQSQISQQQIAEDIGISRTQLSNIERGARGTTVERLEEYAEAVGCRLLVQIVPKDSELAYMQVDPDSVALASKIHDLPISHRLLLLDMVKAFKYLPNPLVEAIRAQLKVYMEAYGPKM